MSSSRPPVEQISSTSEFKPSEGREEGIDGHLKEAPITTYKVELFENGPFSLSRDPRRLAKMVLDAFDRGYQPIVTTLRDGRPVS